MVGEKRQRFRAEWLAVQGGGGGARVINLVKNSRAFKCTIIIAARMEESKNFSFAEAAV